MTTQTDDRPSTEERVSRLEGAYDHLATKADVAELRTEVVKWRADIAAMESRLRADLSAMESRLIRWLVSAVGVGVAVNVALNKLLG